MRGKEQEGRLSNSVILLLYLVLLSSCHYYLQGIFWSSILAYCLPVTRFVVYLVVAATAVDADSAGRRFTVTFPNNLKILFALAFIWQSQSRTASGNVGGAGGNAVRKKRRRSKGRGRWRWWLRRWLRLWRRRRRRRRRRRQWKVKCLFGENVATALL